jgi:hypothetical protein
MNGFWSCLFRRRRTIEFDKFDPFDDGINVTASRLLDDHHTLVPVSDFGDEIADNCELCPFAAGWLTDSDGPGHATASDSAEVRAWIASRLRR